MEPKKGNNIGRIPLDKNATPTATSASAEVSGRRAAARHAPFQGVDPVPVTVAPRLVDESETRVRMGREQHPQRVYALPVVVDGHAGSAQGVVQYGLGRVKGCLSCHDAFHRIWIKGRPLRNLQEQNLVSFAARVIARAILNRFHGGSAHLDQIKGRRDDCGRFALPQTQSPPNNSTMFFNVTTVNDAWSASAATR